MFAFLANPAFWSAAGSLVSAASNFLGSNEGGEGGEGGVITMPQYPWNEGRQKLVSDFLSQQLRNIQAGELPPYLQELGSSMSDRSRRQAKEDFIGTRGNRSESQYGLAEQRGAALGTGAKGTIAATDKVMQQYNKRLADIDDYINQLMYQSAFNYMQQLPTLSAQQPMGPNSQIFQGQSTPETDLSGIGSLASLLFQSITQNPQSSSYSDSYNYYQDPSTGMLDQPLFDRSQLINTNTTFGLGPTSATV